MQTKRVLGVIPARGGSKGIPKKNIYSISGKPLINYTVEAALASESITHCIVSTDDPEIASVAKQAGAAVPFMRPEELSTDTALSLPVVLHALEYMEEKEGMAYDAVMMLQPTTPLRAVADIDQSVELLFSSEADSVIGVVDVGANHPLRMKRIVNGQLINYIDQGHEDMRPRQELPPVYIRNGAIYLALRSTLVDQQTFSGADSRAFVMPEERSVNIDARSDLLLAEYYIHQNNNK